MARKRCTWTTIDRCEMYALQVNEYEEHRILLRSMIFKTFKGQNAIADAKRFWENIKILNK